MNDEWILGVADVADALRCRVDDVLALVSSGELPTLSMNPIRVRHDDLRAFVRDRQRDALTLGTTDAFSPDMLASRPTSALNDNDLEARHWYERPTVPVSHLDRIAPDANDSPRDSTTEGDENHGRRPTLESPKHCGQSDPLEDRGRLRRAAATPPTPNASDGRERDDGGIVPAAQSSVDPIEPDSMDVQWLFG